MTLREGLYKEGLEAGLHQGLLKGKLEGKLEGKMEVARGLIGLISNEIISEKTGLSLEVINKLEKEVKNS